MDLQRQQAYRAYIEEMTRIYEEAGVLKDRGRKFDPEKHFAKHEIDEDRAKTLFRLLDWDEFAEDGATITPEYAGLLKGSDEALISARDKHRKIMESFADELKLPQEKRISNYAPHVFDQHWLDNGSRPPEFDGLGLNPKVFFGHLVERTGADGFSKNIVSVMDFYGRGAFKKLYAEPMYERILSAGHEMATKTGRPILLDYMYDWVAELRGKPTFMGKKIDRQYMNQLYETQTGKKAWKPNSEKKVLAGLTGLMWTGALVGNVRYPVMQIGTGLITTSSRFGLFRTYRGLMEMATPEGQALAKKIGTSESFKKIYESDAFSKFTNRLSKLGISQTEEFIRGTTALAAVDVYLNKFGFSTWDDAVRAGAHKAIMFEALKASEEVNHLFGAMGRPAWVTRTLLPSRSLGIAATQFLSFIPKQSEELLFQLHQNPGKLIQHLALAGYMSRVAATGLGIDVTNYTGLGYLPTELDEVTAPAMDLMIDFTNFVNAASKRDQAETQKFTEKFLTSLQLAVPFMGLFQTASRNAERIIDEEVKTAQGERLRGLDLGWGRGTEPFGPEIIPLATGQQTIRDRQHRIAADEIWRIKRKKMYDSMKLLRRVGDAFSDGDLAKMLEIESRLLSEYGVELIGNTAIERAQEARYISDLWRQVSHNKKMAHLFIEAAEKHGIKLAP
jgi:hypothetical protein